MKPKILKSLNRTHRLHPCVDSWVGVRDHQDLAPGQDEAGRALTFGLKTVAKEPTVGLLKD